jgi:endonuclease YncB( thermonuclease family)
MKATTTLISNRKKYIRWPRFPAMIGIALIVLATPHESIADVIGPACVVDGNIMKINGKRVHKRCIGGTEVRLFGTIAPNLDQLCDAQDGRKWYCGRASATVLLEAVKGRILNCRGNSKDKDKRLLAVCYLDENNLNKLLVRNGWALAYRRHSESFLKLEKKAAADRKGLWQAMENATFKWRDR